jgi:hypothetical protein
MNYLSGFRDCGLVFRVQGNWLRVYGSGVRSGFRV